MGKELFIVEPKEFYKRIDGKDYRHIYVVGDTHGSLKKLLKQLEDIEFDREKDLLISVGDLIDRGPDSVGMLCLLDEPWFESVRGNHEDMASSAVHLDTDDSVGLWLWNGGRWILKVETGDEREAIMKRITDTTTLPYGIEVQCGEDLYVIAHACYPHKTYEYNKKIDPFETTWDRDRYLYRCKGDEALLFTKGAKLFIHGHNHTKTVEKYGNHVYIATGAYGDDPLTLYKLQ